MLKLFIHADQFRGTVGHVNFQFRVGLSQFFLMSLIEDLLLFFKGEIFHQHEDETFVLVPQGPEVHTSPDSPGFDTYGGFPHFLSPVEDYVLYEGLSLG